MDSLDYREEDREADIGAWIIKGSSKFKDVVTSKIDDSILINTETVNVAKQHLASFSNLQSQDRTLEATCGQVCQASWLATLRNIGIDIKEES